MIQTAPSDLQASTGKLEEFLEEEDNLVDRGSAAPESYLVYKQLTDAEVGKRKRSLYCV